MKIYSSLVVVYTAPDGVHTAPDGVHAAPDGVQAAPDGGTHCPSLGLFGPRWGGRGTLAVGWIIWGRPQIIPPPLKNNLALDWGEVKRYVYIKYSTNGSA
jgi:hypothetical protein